MNEFLKIRRDIVRCRNLKELKSKLSHFKIYSLYSFSRFYDIAYKGDKGDRNFYRSIVKNALSPLYIGVGTGRIFSKLYEINPEIKGIDKSIEMITGMLNTYPHISKTQLIVGDILKSKFKKNFDLVVAPFSFLTQFEFEDSLKICKSVYNSLSDGGVFCSDFFSPFDIPKNSFLQIRPVIKNKEIGSYFIVYCYSENYRKLIEYAVIESKNKIFILELKLFSYFPNDILRLLELSGFSKIVVKKGFLKNNSRSKSAPIVVKAYKLGKTTKK